MELVRWENYSVYFFDEDDGSNYVGDFIYNLYKSDREAAERILKLFFERLGEGRGVTQEFIVKHIKDISSMDIFEYKDNRVSRKEGPPKDSMVIPLN